MSNATIDKSDVEQPKGNWLSRTLGWGGDIMQRASAWIDNTPRIEGKRLLSSVEDAMRVPAVNACVNAKVNGIAGLPIVLNELVPVKDEDGNNVLDDDGNILRRLERKSPLTDHRARVLGEFWNEEQTAHDGMAMWIRDYMLYGRAYVEIARRGNGVLSALKYHNQQYVMLTKQGYKITSLLHADGSVQSAANIPPIEPRNMLVLQYESNEGIDSSMKSPVQECMDSINLAWLLQQSSMDYFKRGAPPYLMKLAFTKDKKAMQRMLSQMKKMAADLRNSGSDFGYAPSDAEIVKLGQTPQENLFIDQRTFQVQEICRIIGVPPSIIHENSRSTYSNAAQATSAFLRLGLQPLMDKIKQEMNLKIFGSQRNSTARVDFDTVSFERTEMAKHLETLLRGKMQGVLTANELRTVLGYDRNEQDGSDMLTMQMQNQPMGNGQNGPFGDEPNNGGSDDEDDDSTSGNESE